MDRTDQDCTRTLHLNFVSFFWLQAAQEKKRSNSSIQTKIGRVQ